MKNAGKFGLVLVGLTILVIALIDVTSDKQVDWTRTYDQRDKIPFGLYVVRQELPRILGEQGAEVTDVTATNYTYLRDFLRGKENSSLVYIVDQFYEGKEVTKELIAFAERGGEVFISSNSLPVNFLDTLGIEQHYYYPQNFDDVIDTKDRAFMLNDGRTAFYKDLEYPGLFYDLDTIGVSIIGYFEAEGREVPNFLEVKRGKGRFLLHLEPLMFTNYYFLQRRNFMYASSALKFITRQQVYWYDGHSTGQQARTPLRVLLQHAGLRQAWYILLFSLILFLLFRSKREQKAVPVIPPEPNLSREFAKTIATLYYESGHPGNLVQKKIEYFLYELRTHFQLDILKLEEEDFAQQLALKSGVALSLCEYITARVIRCKKTKISTDKELVELNKDIEEFKHNANML
ncbi:DUF4350 domain-containing protein [Sphingobacterium suaedae]|uniref:DUF4350 domain-containing protein n=1 Tax=Sphingobacterium suaedae TaxID=1686402 RepID=A0ABW5KNJ4_9SPHI